MDTACEAGTSEWTSGSPSGILEWPGQEPSLTRGGVRCGHGRHGGIGCNLAQTSDLESSMSMIIRLGRPPASPKRRRCLGAFMITEDGLEQCVGQVLPMETNEGLLYFLAAPACF